LGEADVASVTPLALPGHLRDQLVVAWPVVQHDAPGMLFVQKVV
jgi:hypothetical protein